jgi:hypothetical protein
MCKRNDKMQENILLSIVASKNIHGMYLLIHE